MRNLFVVGREVEGESQIGYQRYLDMFTDSLLTTYNNISIIGLYGFGKTSLVKEVLERVNEEADGKTITIFVNLGTLSSFPALLHKVSAELHKELEAADAAEVLEDDKYKRYKEVLDTDNRSDWESIKYRNTFEDVFTWLCSKPKRSDKKPKPGCRVILAIDEFDKASDKFTQEDFELLRDLFSGRDIRASLVLVSRRRINMIEKKNFSNSTFHGIVQTERIDGFDEEDMKLYYGVLKDKYGIDVSEDVRERLRYYCGRSPYLLSMFAQKIVEAYPFGDGDLNVENAEQIYDECNDDINQYYEGILTYLKDDKIPGEKMSTMEKLIGVIMGPIIGIGKEDIGLLRGMGYLYREGDEYKSISGHFTNCYLRREARSVDAWAAIINVDKKIKAVIRKQIMLYHNVEYITYDLWNNIFSPSELTRYDKFIEDTMRERDYQIDSVVDPLDVCGMTVAVTILKRYWSGWFSKFFNNDSWDKWEDKLLSCAKARNPIAHGHPEFLSPERVSAVNTYCKMILDQLSDTDACLEQNVELKQDDNRKKVEVFQLYFGQRYSNADAALLGESVRVTAAYQSQKGISGYFTHADKKYKCCAIPKKLWEAQYPNTPLSDHLGKEFPMKITSVNQDSCNVEFV